MTLFTKASKVERHLKVLVYGPSGTGKTKFALSFAAAGRIAVIDTEGGTALYGGKHEFDVLRTKDFATVMQAIAEMKADGGKTYAALVIDPITILWETLQDAGQQMVEKRASRQQGAGLVDLALTQRDWGILKRQYKKLMTELANLPMHVVLTARQKDVTDSQGNIVKVAIDGEKSTTYTPDIVLRFKGGAKYTVVVEKDRSEQFATGAEINSPTYATFAAATSRGVAAPMPDDDAAATSTAALLSQEDAPATVAAAFAAIRDLQRKLDKELTPDAQLSRLSANEISELGRSLKAELSQQKQEVAS